MSRESATVIQYRKTHITKLNNWQEMNQLYLRMKKELHL